MYIEKIEERECTFKEKVLFSSLSLFYFWFFKMQKEVWNTLGDSKKIFLGLE